MFCQAVPRAWIVSYDQPQEVKDPKYIDSSPASSSNAPTKSNSADRLPKGGLTSVTAAFSSLLRQNSAPKPSPQPSSAAKGPPPAVDRTTKDPPAALNRTTKVLPDLPAQTQTPPPRPTTQSGPPPLPSNSSKPQLVQSSQPPSLPSNSRSKPQLANQSTQPYIAASAPPPSLPSRPHAASAPPPLVRYAIASHDFESTTATDLGFKKGQMLRIISQTGNWWRAELVGKEGDIPSTYVQLLPTQSQIAKVLFDFHGQEATDLPVAKGTYVVVKSKSGNWWNCESDGRTGDVPFNYLQQ